MFHGTIHNRRKGPACFWEKDWGNICLWTYDEHILPNIEALYRDHPNYFFMKDNALCHRSALTATNLF
jgi:hypothetical protein